jgi:beta-galactosidase
VPESAVEAFLTVRWSLRRAESWAPAGHDVAWDQVTLRAGRRAPVPVRRGRHAPPVDIAPRPTIWRAATDNDGFKMMPHLWAGFGRSLERWISQGVPIDDADLVASTTTRTERTDGSVAWEHVFEIPDDLADLPRIGVWFELPARFATMRWFGRGPHENYPDRRASATVGVWSGIPDELPYLVPQEFGLRTDCRWVEFGDPTSGEVLRVEIDGGTAHFSATHHRAADLHSARDRTELVRRSSLVVHLDVAHRGLGTASCGPDTLAHHRIGTGTFVLRWVASGR